MKEIRNNNGWLIGSMIGLVSLAITACTNIKSELGLSAPVQLSRMDSLRNNLYSEKLPAKEFYKDLDSLQYLLTDSLIAKGKTYVIKKPPTSEFDTPLKLSSFTSTFRTSGNSCVLQTATNPSGLIESTAFSMIDENGQAITKTALANEIEQTGPYSGISAFRLFFDKNDIISESSIPNNLNPDVYVIYGNLWYGTLVTFDVLRAPKEKVKQKI